MSPSSLLSPTYDGRNFIGTNTTNKIDNSNAKQFRSGSTTFFCLSRLINSSANKTIPINQLSKEDAPRRLSWERRDPANSRLMRSSSIDSMVEAVWNETPRLSLNESNNDSNLTNSSNQEFKFPHTPQSFCKSSNLLGTSIRRESLLSPSAGRRTKQYRGINGELL